MEGGLGRGVQQGEEDEARQGEKSAATGPTPRTEREATHRPPPGIRPSQARAGVLGGASSALRNAQRVAEPRNHDKPTDGSIFIAQAFLRPGPEPELHAKPHSKAQSRSSGR